MLRIVTEETGGERKLVLYGQLAGPWVAEFQSAWATECGVSGCLIDITEVTFVDDAGAMVLCEMKASGVQILASGIDTTHLLAEENGDAADLRRCLSWLSGDL